MAIELNQWAFDMLQKIDTLFQPNVYEGKYNDLFLNLVQNYERQTQSTTQSCHTMALTVAIWTLVRIFRTNDLQIRQQYEQFLNQLLLTCLLMEKIMQMEDQRRNRIVVTSKSLNSTILPPQTVLPDQVDLPL